MFLLRSICILTGPVSFCCFVHSDYSKMNDIFCVVLTVFWSHLCWCTPQHFPHFISNQLVFKKTPSVFKIKTHSLLHSPNNHLYWKNSLLHLFSQHSGKVSTLPSKWWCLCCFWVSSGLEHVCLYISTNTLFKILNTLARTGWINWIGRLYKMS